jgi:hypothetical protein
LKADNDKPTAIHTIISTGQLKIACVLLTSLSRIGSVEVASDVSANPVKEAEASPALVLLALDSSYVDSEIVLILHQIKSTWPGARTAVLVENESQYR